MQNTSPENSRRRGLLSLIGTTMLASFVSSGCADYQGPCGVPEIENQTSGLSTEFITARIRSAIQRGEDAYAPIACGTDSVRVLNDEEFDEEYGTMTGGAYNMRTNQVTIQEAALGYDQTTLDHIVSHELGHSQQDQGEMGWPEWEDTFRDIGYHGQYSPEQIEGVYWDPQCVTFYACADPAEHHAETTAEWMITPLSYLDIEPLEDSMKEAKTSTSDTLIPAYSQIDRIEGFHNEAGEDNYYSYLRTVSGELQKLRINEVIPRRTEIILERENGPQETYVIERDHNITINREGFCESERGIYMLATEEGEIKIIELDLSTGEFSDVATLEDLDWLYTNRIDIRNYNNKIYIFDPNSEEAGSQEKIKYFDLGTKTWEEIGTDITVMRKSDSMSYSNINAQGYVVVYLDGAFSLLDLNTGETLSRTYNIGNGVVKRIALTDENEFYAVMEMEEGGQVLLEGAEGDVRMRYAKLEGTSELQTAIVIGDEVYFGYWDSEKGTTLLVTDSTQ